MRFTNRKSPLKSLPSHQSSVLGRRIMLAGRGRKTGASASERDVSWILTPNPPSGVVLITNSTEPDRGNTSKCSVSFPLPPGISRPSTATDKTCSGPNTVSSNSGTLRGEVIRSRVVLVPETTASSSFSTCGPGISAAGASALK